MRKFKLPRSSPTIKEVGDFKHFSIDEFRADLLQAPWDIVFSFDDPNTCWILWKSFFHETLNKHAPLRQKRVRSNPIPWITPAIKQTMRNRDFHKKRSIRWKSSYHWQIYQNLRNKANREMKLSKSQFYHSEIQHCTRSGNLKKTWSLINYLTGKNKKSTRINEILVNNKTISDSKIIAEYFNEYFVNQPASMLNSTFHFSQINVENVALTLHNLKANKSTGLDRIKYQLKLLNYHQILLPHL